MSMASDVMASKRVCLLTFIALSGVYSLKSANVEDAKGLNIDISATDNESNKVTNVLRKKRHSPICEKSETEIIGQDVVCKGALVFNEDFSEHRLDDLDQWKAEVMFPEGPDYPFNVYMKDAIKVQDGRLTIGPETLEAYYDRDVTHEKLELEGCTGDPSTSECKRQGVAAFIIPPVVTGKITTKERFNFKYGRVEISAKLPGGAWLVPEVNLEPTEKIYGSKNYESGLIRVAFVLGNAVSARNLYQGPILADSEPYRSYWLRKTDGKTIWNQNFHNYTLVWRPDGFQMHVDGEKKFEISPEEGFSFSAKDHNISHAVKWKTPMAPFDEFFHISLGLRVGGMNDFQDIPPKPWVNKSTKALWNFWKDRAKWLITWINASLQVAYVKVYAL